MDLIRSPVDSVVHSVVYLTEHTLMPNYFVDTSSPLAMKDAVDSLISFIAYACSRKALKLHQSISLRFHGFVNSTAVIRAFSDLGTHSTANLGGLLSQENHHSQLLPISFN